MGDREVRPNGLLPSEAASGVVTRALDAERWGAAEVRTAELIASIQPNRPSEERRNAVANYVQRLIAKCFSCQVFTFGSVPLKTYLPDGDIDLTAFSNNESLKDNWANEVRDALENEERSENTEFRVREVQYIQAEVKLIKCLVENIVVDISFNQVGGLCTLCFLEEIDHLINQNHLFKRSIILIKAWCYYESRILGAHHGLISTYALETLVLYIFHVFNNSFAGPLEVLYRFLEFFSNFDWDNFCVSLWGPVAISSLPDMAAEPPRKDSDGLLLSKHFLDACSTVYAVFPVGQENQRQSFVSKYFNVIDPLRTNNNLGRSVSKGNFFRIRSAFAFGAKRLTRLLECPKENIIAEVNQFFMNTWERHGSGNRPDAPNSSLWNLRPSETVPLEEPTTSRSTASIKNKSENVGLQEGHEHHTANARSFHNSAPQVIKTINQHLQNAHRTSNPTLSRMQNQRSYGNSMTSRDPDQSERSISSSASGQAEKSLIIMRPDYSVNDQEEQGRFLFARTCSSPELTDTTAEILSRVRRNRVLETVKTQNSYSRVDNGCRQNNLGSEVSDGHSARSSFNVASDLRHNSPHQSLEVSTDANSASNSYCDDTDFINTGEERTSVSKALELQQELQQEEQDLVNMMASSRVHSFNGQLQLPMHLASHHLPLHASPFLASMGNPQKILTGAVPSNFTFIDPSWGSGMQFPQGFVSSPMSPYFHTYDSLSSDPENVVESSSETSGMTGLNPQGSDHGIWHEYNSESSRGLVSDNGGAQLLHSEGKNQAKANGSNGFIPSSRESNSSAFVRGQQKIPEHKGTVDNQADASLHLTTRGNDLNSSDSYSSLRFFPVSQASSSRSKSSSENSRDGSSGIISKSARDKWGRKSSSTVVGSVSSKTKSGWQCEGSFNHVSPQEDGDSKDWVPLSTMSTDMVDRIPGSTSRNHQVARLETAQQISGQDSVIPNAPMIVGNSQQRVVDNSGAVPITFYPTGPPVPFLTMLPVYHFPSNKGNPDTSASHFDKDVEVDDNRINVSGQNFDSTDIFDHAETHITLAAPESNTPQPSEAPKLDILTSDFSSHWKNLQFGRHCQNNHNHGPLVYPSSVMVPPVYVQGHVPWEGPGRPVSANLNFFTQAMNYGPRLFPMTPIQPGLNRPSGVFQRYGDEAPRFRGGTGTYLPNPKVPFRERQYPSTRNHRGYNYERNDHGDREGSWIAAKARAAGRSHGRSQNDKPSTRLYRSGPSDTRAGRTWESHRYETVASCQAHNSSFGPSNSAHGSASMPYGVYPMPSVSSNGVDPSSSVVMLYPFDKEVGHGSSSESSLEFGSLGQVPISTANEAPRSTESNLGRRIHEQRRTTYRENCPRSSPDQSSSPHIQRRL
ncbi:uncharacterized protein M6B38_284895 [Iris pallida]|uniref:Polymerase nucleotidyl transferase domain-containing protein n=1 Tax=Iris pallida TaxID=29817 RepID=A0AAX6I1Q6_IRIPA|nr:uncharacterized protein M6B38_284895 [Iris pallida]